LTDGSILDINQVKRKKKKKKERDR